MQKSFIKVLEGYQRFRKKYVLGDSAVMQYLSDYGQQPEIMVVACCDSRVDPGVILDCGPGELFVVRNVANIVPPYEKDEAHHGTSAALEFGVRFLKVKHLVLLGHSQCAGIQALVDQKKPPENDFITQWVSLIKIDKTSHTDNRGVQDNDAWAKFALNQSYENCLTFPWIREKVRQQALMIHLWFFDIKTGQIFNYINSEKKYQPLDLGE